MLHRDPLAPTLANRLRGVTYTAGGAVVRWTWARVCSLGAIGPRSADARRFGSFGDGSVICFPSQTVVNEQAIHIGRDTMVAPDVTLSAGWGPGQADLPDRVLVIGDRCLIGRGSALVAHRSIVVGDDVWTGHGIYVTDMNHGYEDVDRPISVQNQPEAPVVIGRGSWLGHGVVVLPGVRIGEHVVVGANSVVSDDLPDFSVAVGAPARVIRIYTPGLGWVDPRHLEGPSEPSPTSTEPVG